MLNAMRDGAHSKIIKFVLFGFLVMAVAGMAVMDVGGFFTSGVGTNNVARAGKEAISAQAFDRSLQRVLAQQGMQPREAYEFGMVDQILQSEISQILLAQSAHQRGLYIDNTQVAKQIASLIDPLVKSQPGATRGDMLRRLLQTQGMSEQQLVESIRRSMMTMLVQGTVEQAGSVATKSEALNLYLVRNETRAAEGFILADDTITGIETADDAVLTAFYEAAKSSRFVIPETRSFRIAILEESHVRSNLTISDSDIEAEYKKSVAAYTQPERRVIEQAVVNDEATAGKIAALASDGKTSLKDAVKSVTGKTTAYQPATTLARQGLVKTVGDAAFSATAGAVVPPVQTPLGWHVLVVKEILPESVKPLSAVKGELQKALAQDRLSQELYNTANAIDDRLAGGDDVAAIAKDMGMTITTIGPVTAEGSTPDKQDALKAFPAKDRDYILQSAFDLAEGESAPVLELSDGRYAALHVDTVTERSFKPYESVKDTLKKNWIDDQKAAANLDRARKIQQDIESGTTTLAAAAAKAGARVERFTALKQGGDAPKALGQGAVEALFKAVQGETVLTAVPGGHLIGTVTSVSLPDPAKVSDKDLEPLLTAAKRANGGELAQSFLQHLHDTMKVRINRHQLDTLYGPESGS